MFSSSHEIRARYGLLEEVEEETNEERAVRLREKRWIAEQVKEMKAMSAVMIDPFEAAAEKTAKAKKDKLPAVVTGDTEACQRLTQMQQYAKDLEQEIKALKADLSVKAESERVALSRSQNKHVDSIEFNGLKYVTKNQYSPIPHEGASLLKDAFGEQFVTFFAEGFEVKIDSAKASVLTLEQKQALVAMGATIAKVLKPTTAYHEARTLNAEVAAKHNTLGVVKQFSPSLGE